MRSVRIGALVRLRGPRAVRGRSAVVRRRLPRGYEVELRTPLGTPLHLVVPARRLGRPRPEATAAR